MTVRVRFVKFRYFILTTFHLSAYNYFFFSNRLLKSELYRSFWDDFYLLFPIISQHTLTTPTMTSRTSCRDGERACAVLGRLWNSYHVSPINSIPPKLPRTSLERLFSKTDKTILYLAYGSNLSAETFKGNRGIKPLSAVNVHVPGLSLTFDLPGIPYAEPCFANTCYRTSPAPEHTAPLPFSDNDYHKDQWKKGLIGVVYEVTPDDYRTIIATEGGGASYQDVVVDCYAIGEGDKTVDPAPSGSTFKAHTLLSPEDSSSGPVPRPDPSYAQASARYLKLITDGGEEHALPDEYMAYLYNLRPYTITTKRQRMGSVLFLGIWLPVIIFLLAFTKSFADKDGKIPQWLARGTGFVFDTVWVTYDVGFKNVFGDGERTMGDDDDEERSVERWCEKTGVRWC